MVFPVNAITEHAQCMAGKARRRQEDEQASISQIKSYLTVTMTKVLQCLGKQKQYKGFMKEHLNSRWHPKQHLKHKCPQYCWLFAFQVTSIPQLQKKSFLNASLTWVAIQFQLQSNVKYLSVISSSNSKAQPQNVISWRQLGGRTGTGHREVKSFGNWTVIAIFTFSEKQKPHLQETLKNLKSRCSEYNHVYLKKSTCSIW